MNIFLKLIGYEHNYGGRGCSYKFSWGEIALLNKDISFRWSGPRYCFEPKLIVALHFITFYIRTPSFGVKAAQSSKEERNYGFYLFPNLNNWEATVFKFYNKSLHIEMPWTYKWKRTELLDWDMKTVCKEEAGKRDWHKWYNEKEAWVKDNAKTYDYTYVLKNGTVQNRKATCHIERRTWTVRWAPWVKMVSTTLDVKFDDEVGERSGSWKGGTTGCSYEMLHNETPEQTLRRMESERKF
jgi:hypothetical protein